MSETITISRRSLRVGIIGAGALAATFVAGLCASTALAGLDSEGTIRTCVSDTGVMRSLPVGTDACASDEVPVDLPTRSALDAATGTIAQLQSDVDELERVVVALGSEIIAMGGDLGDTFDGWDTPLPGDVGNIGDLTTPDASDELERLLEAVVIEGDDVVFEGVNVHIRNGLGSTSFMNGTGNLIVGYAGTPDTELGLDEKRSGSHNVVIGDGHSWDSTAGLLSGYGHSLTAPNAVAIGGFRNTVLAPGGAAIAGDTNAVGSAAYNGAAIAGWRNIVDGGGAATVAGSHNTAGGVLSALLAGYDNTTGFDASYSAVSGGANHDEGAPYASASGS